jgi:hypothetical protein
MQNMWARSRVEIFAWASRSIELTVKGFLGIETSSGMAKNLDIYTHTVYWQYPPHKYMNLWLELDK